MDTTFRGGQVQLEMRRTWADGVRLAFAGILYTATITILGVIVALVTRGMLAAIFYGLGCVVLFVVAFLWRPNITLKLMDRLVARAEKMRGEFIG
jgi:hypothetical protein